MGYSNLNRKKVQDTSKASVWSHGPNTSISEKPFPKFISPMQDESLSLVAHPSVMNYVWWFVFGVLCILVLPLGAVMIHHAQIFLFATGIPVSLLGVVMILYAYISIKTTCFVVTNRRIVVKTGLFNVHQTDVHIDDIRAVNLKSNLWQRMIGVGDVAIGTAATGGTEVMMIGVYNPKHFVDMINSKRRN